MEIIKTHTRHFTVERLALGWLPIKTVLKIRKERACWSCGRVFEKLADSRLSLCTTDQGNKIICNDCALAMAEEGVPVTVNRLDRKLPRE